MGASIWSPGSSVVLDSASLAALTASNGSSKVGFIAAGVGALARTMQDKARDWIDISDYALGNGADEHVAIQKAVNAAAGSMLVFRPTATGYASTIPITVPANTTLLGCGSVFTNLLSDIFVADSVDKLDISEFNFIGNNALIPSTTIAAAGTFTPASWYQILTIGSTDFVAIGAATNTVGVIFQAAGIGAGTGTANPIARGAVAIWCKDTSAPCSYVNVHDNNCYQIKLFSSFTTLHQSGVPYTYTYYRTAANIARHIKIHNNTGYTSAPWTGENGGTGMFVQVGFSRNVTVSNNTLQGFCDAIQLLAGGAPAFHDWAQDIVGGDSTICGNSIQGTNSGISVISCNNVSVSGNTICDVQGDTSLDAELCKNVSFTGNTLENVLRPFSIFWCNANISFVGNTASVIADGQAWYPSVVAPYANAGEIIYANNVVTGPATAGHLVQFPLGAGVKSYKITGNTFTNIYWPGSNKVNGFIFTDNTLIYEVAPPAWALATPDAISATYTKPATVPTIIVENNQILNRTAAFGSIGTGIEIQTCTVACKIRIQGNHIEAGLSMNIPDPTGTAMKTIQVVNNTLHNTVGPIKSSGAYTIDRIFYSDNIDLSGLDPFALLKANGPNSGGASSAIWQATGINVYFTVGSKIMAIDPAGAAIPGWYCITAGHANGGTGVWKTLPVLGV